MRPVAIRRRATTLANRTEGCPGRCRAAPDLVRHRPILSRIQDQIEAGLTQLRTAVAEP